MTTITQTTAEADVQTVRAAFEAVGAADLAAFARCFHADAAWNHRNPDRLGGVKRGIDEILAFLGASMELTAGTLQPVPQRYLPGGAGHVAVVTRITAARPDGRTFDDTQILYFQLTEGKVHWVDQYVGDPPAVADFWA